MEEVKINDNIPGLPSVGDFFMVYLGFNEENYQQFQVEYSQVLTWDGSANYPYTLSTGVALFDRTDPSKGSAGYGTLPYGTYQWLAATTYMSPLSGEIWSDRAAIGLARRIS